MNTCLSQCHHFTIDQNMFGYACIAGLLKFRRPSAIRWRIREIIIDSINRMCRRWSMSHVLNKSFKRQPFIAHCNATASITRKTLIFWIRASLKHVAPASIFRSVRHSMRHYRISKFFGPQAPATFNAFPKLIRYSRMRVPTVASTQPKNPLGGSSNNRQGCKSSKFNSCSIYLCWHAHHVTGVRT